METNNRFENQAVSQKIDDLRRFLEEQITSAYAEYEEVSSAKVKVSESKVEIRFNSEIPYLGRNFFTLIGDVEKAIEDKLKAEGYIYQKTECLYDFIIWYYKKDSED